MSIAPRTSHIRVFGKSMFTLSAGWLVSVTWLWYSEFHLYLFRHGTPPPGYDVGTVLGGIPPALLLALGGWIIRRLAGPASSSSIESREWWYAFLWSVIPNALLVATVWVMIQEAR
ncbi:MAG: hypothetical protein LBQ09_06565 [Acidobacteriaceae bacterium]|jgi:hypothetical protein|nr:hypothetical protein [Acidobacteriaceae bacterium]